MAMFNKNGPATTDGRSAPGGEGALSIIAAGMAVTGDVETNGVIKIEGTVTGSILGARQVLLGRQGEIKGDVNAREVVLGGRVQGNVHASERVEIQATSVVHGDIVAKSIVVVEGGRINGSVRMDDVVEGRQPELVKSPPVAVVR
jgi:cytoskeletal protein CcmA (bactofilin family)